MDITDVYRGLTYGGAGHPDDLKPDTVEPCQFIITANQIIQNIQTIRQLVGQHEVELIEQPDRVEHESFDSECQMLLRTCKERIETLRHMSTTDAYVTSMVHPGEESVRAGARRGRREVVQTHDQANAHRLGVVSCLYEALATTASKVDDIRLFHMDSVTRAKDDEKLAWGSSGATESHEVDEADEDGSDSLSDESSEDAFGDATVMAQENAELRTELDSMVDNVREVEAKVRDISTLSSLFNATISEQAANIEMLFDTALSTSTTLDNANKVLTKTSSESGGFRLWIVFFLLTASSSLLFLDWYQG